MFKFIKDHIERMDHAQVYPLISLLIFFLFFVVLLWYVKKMDKSNLSVLSNIPLEGNEENNQSI